MRYKKFKTSRVGLKEFKPNFVVLARNVKTGALVRIPVTTREEVKRMRWYPQNDYALIDINPKFNPKTDRKKY